jgi:hypothetical protein
MRVRNIFSSNDISTPRQEYRHHCCHHRRYDATPYGTPDGCVYFELGNLDARLGVLFAQFFEIAIDPLDLQQNVLAPLSPAIVGGFAIHSTIVGEDDI